MSNGDSAYFSPFIFERFDSLHSLRERIRDSWRLQCASSAVGDLRFFAKPKRPGSPAVSRRVSRARRMRVGQIVLQCQSGRSATMRWVRLF